jgi:hypothetical protein
MTRFKDFGSGSSDSTFEPLSFKIYDQEFQCVPQIQGKLLISLVSSSSSEDPIKAAQTITTFFDYVLVKESKERFNELLESPETIVTVETLSEIVAWLIEEYTARPNQQPED